MRKKTGALLLTATLMVSMTTACGTINRDNNRNDQYRTRNISRPAPILNQSRPYSTPNGSRSYSSNSINNGARNLNHTDGNAAMTAANKALADRISKKATAVRGVDKATVFVHGKDALVGLDIKRGMNARSVETRVRNSVKNMEPGYKVHITSDKALHGRIRDLQARLNGTTGTDGMRPYTLNNGSYSMHGANTPGMYNGYGMGGTTRGLGFDGTTRGFGFDGTTRGLGFDGTTRGLGFDGTTRGLGFDGTNRMFGRDGYDGTYRGLGFGDNYSQNHPIRSFADDVGDLIRDIGNAITYPLR